MGSNVFVGVKLPGNSSGEFGERYATDPSRVSKLPSNYDYVLLPITNARYRENVRSQFENFQQQRRAVSECVLKIKEPQLQELCIPPFNPGRKNDGPAFIGLLSSWLELENADNSVRELCYQVLLNECRYARFVGIDKLIVAPPRKLSELHRYSQVISRLLNDETVSAYPRLTLSVSLPLYEDSDPLATWELWHTVRKLCSYHPSLTISLAVPRIRTPSHVLNRWLSEPVSCLLLSSSIFATNQYGYPVLHKFNQSLITKFQGVNGNSLPDANGELCIIIHGMEKYVDQIKGGEGSYLEYINFLLKKGDKQLFSSHEDLSNGSINQVGHKTAHQDNSNSHNINTNHNPINSNGPVSPNFRTPRLMKPLKPHSETLSNYVYSIFEKDLAKYNMYQAAIEQALTALLSEHRTSPLTILIAGAGRGPLVDRTVLLLKKFNVLNQAKVIALEKNPQAGLYLQKRNFDLWHNKVEIVIEDMRQWRDKSVKADLCISELLGSFGCNELSPECLFAIEQHHSKPDTIFIPQSYTSYIAPIACPLIYQNLREKEGSQESPWVMHNIPYCILSSRINELWSFHHPLRKRDSEDDLFSRNAVTEFKIKHRGEIHGILGFFTAQLYNDITLSTVPDDSIVKVSKARDGAIGTHLQKEVRSPQEDSGVDSDELKDQFRKLDHTPNMHSWSPLVFPLNQPFVVTDDTELAVFLSRNHAQLDSATWYEWSVESYVYLVSSDTSLSRTTPRQTVDPRNHSSRNRENAPARNSRTSKKNETLAFDNSISDNNFSPNQENVWQSVSDIHGLTSAVHKTTEPMFNLKDAYLECTEDEDEEEEEVHIRVKTGVSTLHNANGKFFSVAL
ncbi:hypothetical protein HG536_0B01850 [Torulaspora globosa]|uniref:Uncharacterized protein n=1 Tax=Torulaspora globosa TaxID=48254 RepID=A0A7G3ZCT6_9SACH|nr:uncharacterized protein HG536_0B01850 [Torulaspora globosa]QLL31322.1 hypothetical protein HG536_0B01850 [Torulaspora globosa]